MENHDCIICNIINEKEKSFIVLNESNCIAFLDKHPLFKGHCLLTPRNHFRTYYDLPENQLFDFFKSGQRIAKAIELAFQAEGTFIAINNKVSQSIPHLHMHIVPRKKGDGLKGFFWPRAKYLNEAEILETQRRIQDHIK